MDKALALKIIIDLVKSLKPSLRATEQVHAEINQALKTLEESEKSVDQVPPQQ